MLRRIANFGKRGLGILILSPDGPLEKADFERVSPEIGPFIAANSKLRGIMIVAKAFPGWDSFGASVVVQKFASLSPRVLQANF
jgi:hypothetical protein